MKAKIDVEGTEREGVCYDYDRALEEGLFDEVRVWRLEGRERGTGEVAGAVEVTVSPELAQALMETFDLSVNVGPDDLQIMQLRVTYQYSYGDADPV